MFKHVTAVEKPGHVHGKAKIFLPIKCWKTAQVSLLGYLQPQLLFFFVEKPRKHGTQKT
jgi:hypothetical protein